MNGKKIALKEKWAEKEIQFSNVEKMSFVLSLFISLPNDFSF